MHLVRALPVALELQPVQVAEEAPLQEQHPAQVPVDPILMRHQYLAALALPR